ITSKIVSKAEGRYISKRDVTPSTFAFQLAQSTGRDPYQIEIVLRESTRPIKIADHVLIFENKNGQICANAGVDQSNIDHSDGKETYLMLPENPDHSASMIRDTIQRNLNTKIAVIISDTFGRPWRMGQTNVA